MTLEANIVRAIQRLLDQRDAWHFKTTGVTAAGIPDINGSYRGRALALEVKQPGRKPTRRQTYQLERARAAGAIAEVVHCAADVARLLDAIDQELAT
jgi:hypothetical protein